jgi:hypothetical protein
MSSAAKLRIEFDLRLKAYVKKLVGKSIEIALHVWPPPDELLDMVLRKAQSSQKRPSSAAPKQKAVEEEEDDAPDNDTFPGAKLPDAYKEDDDSHNTDGYKMLQGSRPGSYKLKDVKGRTTKSVRLGDAKTRLDDELELVRGNHEDEAETTDADRDFIVDDDDPSAKSPQPSSTPPDQDDEDANELHSHAPGTTPPRRSLKVTAKPNHADIDNADAVVELRPVVPQAPPSRRRHRKRADRSASPLPTPLPSSSPSSLPPVHTIKRTIVDAKDAGDDGRPSFKRLRRIVDSSDVSTSRSIS